ncbi:hypothetical protein BD289DRAFT_440655 [Coniella lustricola]|uniref:Secreted protein n=1 Tax=Coniella lustricola TaxID=2025994 RepID=A0A2T3A0B5_9PEZI|nr:hypothetical protein BD289DRAFT_440655 [Coniella lustricola]
MKFTSATSVVLTQAVVLVTAHSTVIFSYGSQPLNTTQVAAVPQYSMPAIVDDCAGPPASVFGPSTWEAANQERAMRRGTCAGDEMAQVTAMVMAQHSFPTCTADLFGIKSGN